MRTARQLAVLFLCLLCLPAAAAAQEAGASRPPKSPPPEAEMLRPADFVKDFPALRWGMSFAEAQQAVEETGALPVSFKGNTDEMAWHAVFDGMRGRGALFFREGRGLSQIALGIYAFDRRAALFDAWLKRLTDRHGEPAENHDDEVALMRVWRLKNGFALQLRTLKDPNSPVVELTWVKD